MSCLTWSNNKPALVERRQGEGLVLVMTTPISEAETSGRQPWNLISSSLDSWPFLVLVDRMFLSLVRSDDASLNCTVGQVARLPWDAGRHRTPAVADASRRLARGHGNGWRNPDHADRHAGCLPAEGSRRDADAAWLLGQPAGRHRADWIGCRPNS